MTRTERPSRSCLSAKDQKHRKSVAEAMSCRSMASITLVVGILPVIEWHHLVQEKATLLPSFNYCV